MTAYEIISIFIGILALLMSFGSLVLLRCLPFSTRETSENKNAYSVATRVGVSI